MKNLLNTIFLIGVLSANAQSLKITAVFDGNLPGGQPKGIELVSCDTIFDLSAFGVGSANNGGGSDGEEFIFPADTVFPNQYFYVSADSTGFATFFGFAANYISGALNVNGDDAIELFYNGSVIDVFGDINVDGSGQSWEYMDGWAYRVNGTGSDSASFQLGFWNFSSPNALDPDTTNISAGTPVPIGTYTCGTGPFTLSSTVTSSCLGDAVFMNSTTANGVSPITTIWDHGDGTTSTGSSGWYFFPFPGAYSSTIVAIDSNGLADTMTTIVIVYPLPVINFSYSPFCAGDSTYFNDASTIISGTITSWNWNFDLYTIGSITPPIFFGQTPPGIFFADTGSYNVSLTLISDMGCTSALTNYVIVTPVQLAVIDTANFFNIDTLPYNNYLNGYPVFCSNLGSSFDLLASPSGGIWSGDGIVDSINGTFNPITAWGADTSLLHTVVYSPQGTCSLSDTFYINVMSCLGMAQITQHNDVLIYPNPVVNKLIIQTILGDYNLAIYDITGKLVYRKLEIDKSIINVDMSDFDTGMYIIKVISNNGVYSKRITKM